MRKKKQTPKNKERVLWWQPTKHKWLKRIGGVVFVLLCLAAIFHSEIYVWFINSLQKPPTTITKKHKATFDAGSVTDITAEDIYNAYTHKDELNQTGQLAIPSADMNLAIQPGVDYYTELLGAGEQYPRDIVSMGGSGNYVLASHNVPSLGRYNLLFTNLKSVNVGDLIYTTNGNTVYTYRTTKTTITDISETHWIEQPYDKYVKQITLYTCVSVQTDKYLRQIVQGTLVSQNSAKDMTSDQKIAFSKEEAKLTPWEIEFSVNWNNSRQ